MPWPSEPFDWGEDEPFPPVEGDEGVEGDEEDEEDEEDEVRELVDSPPV